MCQGRGEATSDPQAEDDSVCVQLQRYEIGIPALVASPDRQSRAGFITRVDPTQMIGVFQLAQVRNPGLCYPKLSSLSPSTLSGVEGTEF
jgi:hypothetical protein